MVDSTTPPVGENLTQYMAGNVVNPSVPNSAQLTPVLQDTSNASLQASGQLLNTNPQNTIQPGAVTPVNPQQVTGQTTDPNAAASQVNPADGQYTATQTGAAQGTAGTMTVNKDTDTVQGQLKGLIADTENGQTPVWAQAAVNTVNENLAARGLRPSSSIGLAAMTGAVQNSAINIAAADAQTYFKANLATFDAGQQMELANLQNRQQSMLSNQSADNAAKQFNASSQQQVQEFMASLVSQINSQNADRIQAADTSNQSADQAAQQFNSQQEFNRQQFNAETQFAIDQSNVLWRRELNTANTAAVNAANQFNTQNKFNLSTTAMNNLWQQLRDEASWAFQASENEKNRAYNMAIVSNNQDFITNLDDKSWAEDLAGLAAGILFT